jgi:hypothetical protein
MELSREPKKIKKKLRPKMTTNRPINPPPK